MNNNCDHRIIGEKLKLFVFNDKFKGQVFMLERGLKMMKNMMHVLRLVYISMKYHEVSTPAIGPSTIYETSGHVDKYSDNLFYLNNREHIIKPMNCPTHASIFRTIYAMHNFLPMGIFEFSHCYRNEPDGAVCGMFRLCSFIQDDAHVVCKIDDVDNILESFYSALTKVYKLFGFSGFKCRLSKVNDDFIGSNDDKERSESILLKFLENKGCDFCVSDDGAFYGPKIDFILVDSLDREWQTGTIQIDFNLIKRNDISLGDNRSEDLVLVHHAILGTFHRFMGIMIESCGDELPNSVNPYLCSVICLDDIAFSEIKSDLVKFNLIDRVDIYYAGNRLQKKISHCKRMKYGLISIVSSQDINNHSISLHHKSGITESVSKIDLIKKINSMVNASYIV